MLSGSQRLGWVLADAAPASSTDAQLMAHCRRGASKCPGSRMILLPGPGFVSQGNRVHKSPRMGSSRGQPQESYQTQKPLHHLLGLPSAFRYKIRGQTPFGGPPRTTETSMSPHLNIQVGTIPALTAFPPDRIAAWRAHSPTLVPTPERRSNAHRATRKRNPLVGSYGRPFQRLGHG